ncbi:MAG: DUF6390 family protein [Acidimicrobiia bacterium]|nr:DUF6390 family protein [Acidimicrobiia bacterium]
MNGAVLFARFAYPPNRLGYCGPADHGALLEYGSAGVADAGLVQLARGFEGAWPYLELIAGAAGIPDPLDPRVVEAYWIGNDLLHRVPAGLLGDSLETRFRGPAGRGWSGLTEVVPVGAVPHHAFHVFAVYPWVGLLRTGRVDQPLHVLDRCRVRWGEVVAVDGDVARVRSRPLTWDGHTLGLGEPRVEQAVRAVEGVGFVPGLAPGARVALHWDWVCDVLTPRRLRSLQRVTADQLDLVNRRAGVSGPARILG